MSWNVDLVDRHGRAVYEINYTHNTNHMIDAALVAAGQDWAPPCGGPLGHAIGPAWWVTLNGMSGPMGLSTWDTSSTGSAVTLTGSEG